MEYEVTEDQRSSLREDGIVKLPGLIDSALLAELNACFDWSVDHPGPLAVGNNNREAETVVFIDNANPAGRSRYEDLVIRSHLGQVAADLWDSEFVGFFAEEIFYKKGKSLRTFWHQDTVYSPWGGDHWCNFWIPLVKMTSDQAIQVIRGSHKGVMYDGTTFNPKDPTEPLWGDAGNFPRLPDIAADLAADPDAWDTAGFDVEPGDVVVLHPHCLHSGGATDETLPERRNMVLRFVGDKSFYSGHIPDTKGMYEHKPLAAAAGGFLKPDDPYRPAHMPNLMA